MNGRIAKSKRLSIPFKVSPFTEWPSVNLVGFAACPLEKVRANNLAQIVALDVRQVGALEAPAGPGTSHQAGQHTVRRVLGTSHVRDCLGKLPQHRTLFIRMPIKNSTALRKKLPANERDTIDASLTAKAGGLCFLCGAKIIEATEELVADHDVPETEGGTTQLSNLNLVHGACYSFKRQHPNVNVRPYLTLAAKIKGMGGFLKYDEAVGLLGVSPKTVDIVISGDTAKITTADGVTHKCAILSETNRDKTYRICFCSLPIDSGFNDDECQPRTVKLLHFWQIYSDIFRNPLYEPLACRIVKVTGQQLTHQLILLDGQQKAMSLCIEGRESVIAKIYLDT